MRAGLKKLRGLARGAFYEDAAKIGSGRHAPRMPRFLGSLVLLSLGASVLSWLIFASFARLTVGSGFHYWSPPAGSLPRELLFEITRSTVTAVGILAGLFAIVYAYRKQRIEEAAGHRADEEGLSKRYQDAAKQLGDDKPAVRLAGVYAMARLADDWPEQRQTGLDVLCSYIRMNWDLADPNEGNVRTSIFNLIEQRTRLDARAQASWSRLHFDFKRSVLPGFSLTNCVFSTSPTWQGATFSGSADFTGTTFCDGADFSAVSVTGMLHLNDFALSAGCLSMTGCEVQSGAALNIAPRSLKAGSIVNLLGLSIAGVFELAPPEQHPEEGELQVPFATMTGKALVVLGNRSSSARFAPVYLHQWTVAGGHLYLDARLLRDDLGIPVWSPRQVLAAGAIVKVSDFALTPPPLIVIPPQVREANRKRYASAGPAANPSGEA